MEKMKKIGVRKAEKTVGIIQKRRFEKSRITLLIQADVREKIKNLNPKGRQVEKLRNKVGLKLKSVIFSGYIVGYFSGEDEVIDFDNEATNNNNIQKE